MKERAHKRYTYLLLAGALVLAACSGSDGGTATTSEGVGSSTTLDSSSSNGGTSEPSSSSSSTPAASAEQGGTLRILVQSDTPTLDPAFSSISTTQVVGWTIFNTLLSLTPAGDVEPNLADSWSVEDEGKTYVFDLHPGVTFQDGSDLTAADVKYSIERVRDDPASLYAEVLSVISEIDTPSDQTVVMKLSKSFSPLLTSLASIPTAIVPEGTTSDEEFGANPIGSGPYMLTEWKKDEYIQLDRNPNYWKGDLPYLDAIRFTFNSDPNAQYAALASGAVDFVYNIPISLIDQFRAEGNIDVVGGEGSLHYLYMPLNIHKPPFDNVKVRQAIYAALDRQALADLCLPGASKPLPGYFLPSDNWAGLKEPIWTGDVEQANSLLAEAGYADGFSFELQTVIELPFAKCTAEVIKEQLKTIGVTVNIEMMQAAQINSARGGDLSAPASFDAQIYGRLGVPDPDQRFSQTFTSDAGQNWLGYSDAKLDSLVAEAAEAVDRDERANLYREAGTILGETGPMAFLYNYYKFDAIATDVKGYTWNPFIIYDSLERTWLEN